MRGYYPARRMRYDSFARRIRHNDGLGDLLVKLKEKIKELIKGFSAMPMGKKIVYLLGKMLTIVSMIFTVHTAKATFEEVATVKRQAKVLKSINDKLTEQIGLWFTQEGSGRSTYEAPGASRFYEMPKVKWLVAVAKIVSGLVTAVVGTIASEWAKG